MLPQLLHFCTVLTRREGIPLTFSSIDCQVQLLLYIYISFLGLKWPKEWQKLIQILCNVYSSEASERDVIATIIIHRESNYNIIRNISLLFTPFFDHFTLFLHPSKLDPHSVK